MWFAAWYLTAIVGPLAIVGARPMVKVSDLLLLVRSSHHWLGHNGDNVVCWQHPPDVRIDSARGQTRPRRHDVAA